ncbi:MAG: winged helix-turn-helix domain-containing protein [Bryobacteraceae bacterium]
MKHWYEFGSFRLDATNRLLYRDGDLVRLPPKVADTLLILVAARGQVLSKDEMMKRLWPDTFVEEGTLAQYVFLLRKTLGNSSAWIENHPRRGYRFLAPVTERNADLSPEDSRSGSDIQEVAVKNPGPFRQPRVIANALVVLSVVLAVLVWASQKENAPHSTLGSVAVLPFRAVPASGGDYRADAMTDGLITKLTKLKGLRVVSYSRVRRFKGASREAAEIGRELGVDAVI